MFPSMWRVFALTVVAGCGSSAPAKSSTAPVPPSHETANHTPAVARDAPPSRSVSGGGGPNRCDNAPLGEVTVDGLLDDWRDRRVFAAVGNAADGAIEVRCAWDGSGIAVAQEGVGGRSP